MKRVTVIPGRKNSLMIQDVEIPRLKENEVLVKVKLVGLDRTDQEIINGDHGEAPEGEERLVIGHESLGEVVSVGNQIEELKQGDHVVATVRRPDNCINCQAGEYDLCLKGEYLERGIKGKHGYLSEFYKEEEKFLVKVPKEFGDLALLLEPLSIAEKALRVGFTVQKRMIWKPKTVLVTGSGTLGLLTAMLLRLRNLDVLIVDRSDDEYKKNIFSALNVRHFNTNITNLHDIPDAVGKQIDMILEETGSSSVALHSMSVVGTNGISILLSITGGDKVVRLCSDCLNQGLVLGNKTVVGSVSSHRIDFEQGIEDLSKIEQKWPGILDKLITAKYPLEHTEKALSVLKNEIKVVITF